MMACASSGRGGFFMLIFYMVLAWVAFAILVRTLGAVCGALADLIERALS